MVGNVEGKTCIIVDDIIDTAGTLCKAADLLIENGATNVMACATHGLFSGEALDRIEKSHINAVFVTDTLPQNYNQKKCYKLRVVTLAPLLAEAIQHIHDEKSLNSLFKS